MRATRFIVGLIMLLALGWSIWMWGFCRVYVGPGEMAIVTTKRGVSIPSSQILAQKGEMGVQEDVLGEGRHFLNPIFNSWSIEPIIHIPPRKIGIVKAKGGKDLPQGEFMANPGEKGILRQVLGPGKYRINPRGFEVTTNDAVSIPVGYAGVVTSLSGQQAPTNSFALPSQKGVCEDVLQPGLYYINKNQYLVSIFEVGVNQVSLLGKEGGAIITKSEVQTQNAVISELQDQMIKEQQAKRMEYTRREQLQGAEVPPPQVSAARNPAKAAYKPGQTLQDEKRAVQVLNEYVEFPSRDGFQISLDMTVEFEVLPKDTAWVFKSYGDLPAVVEKVIMPQIMSISRNKGSQYRAIDFIVGEGREKFQKELTEALAKTLLEKRVIIHNTLIRHVEVPAEILDPVQKSSLATEQDLTNKERQNTARKMAELNTEMSLIEQRRGQVQEETRKLRAEIEATQQKEVAEINAGAMKQVAEIEKETAASRAGKVRTLGKAGADSIRLVEGEKANGYQLKGEAFSDPVAYGMWEFANGLKNDLKITVLHAGPGTLWTDLEKADLATLGGAIRINQSADQAPTIPDKK